MPTDRETLQAAGIHPAPCARHCEATAFEIEIRRLKADNDRLRVENAALSLYSPARRAQPTIKTAPIAPPNLAFFGIDETDEEFAERAGRKVTEVAR